MSKLKNWDETIKEYESKGVTNMSAIIALEQAGNREVTEIKEMIRIRQGEIIKDLDDSSPNIKRSEQSIINTDRALKEDSIIKEMQQQLFKLTSLRTTPIAYYHGSGVGDKIYIKDNKILPPKMEEYKGSIF